MSSYEALKQQAQDKLKERNAPEARALFLQAAQAKGVDLQGLSKRGADLLYQGKIPEATEIFLKVIDENPTDVDALLALARASLFLDRPDDAESFLSGVHRMDPENPLGKTLQGLIYETRGQLQQALQPLKEGAQEGKDEFLCQFNYGRVLAAVSQDGQAIPFLVRATELEPKNYDAQYVLGMAMTHIGQFGDAIMAFNQAMQIAPKRLDIYATLADVLVKANDPENAIQALNLGMNQVEEHPALLQKAAAISAASGKFANAVQYLERVVEKLPGYYQAWLNLGNFYILTQDLEKCEEANKKAIEINPDDWQGHYQLGNLYEAVKLYDQAEAAYRKAVSLAPQEARAHANLGIVLLQVDDTFKNKESVTCFEQAIKLAAPGDYRWHYNLALAFGKLNLKPRARDLITEILENSKDEELLDATQALQKNLFSTQDEMKLNLALSSLRGIVKPGQKDE
ncbi:MAG: tetratricopeptide repeat protein [Myxococcales bacterium]|nr:tetratricopeptide repeat protein [Myxococcales bacterium]MCB9643830.1 tetratricopeptide repeat protein [Myxococcales bacterium]